VPFEPWSKYPSLTKDRLTTVGGIVRRVRSDTADPHDSAGGDIGWSLGCRAYARTCFSIRQAVADYVWLSIVSEEQMHRFTFAIGGVPVRFYHGEASDPPSKYLERTFGEFRQHEMFSSEEFPNDCVLRLAIETDAKGRASTITLLEVGSENRPTGNGYEIPTDDLRKVVIIHAKGIDVPAPSFEPILTEEQKQAEELKQQQRKGERDAG
jgi:hypothetical protein